MPKVSVLIPTYQHSRYIGEAILSVLAQSYTDYEIIVVDDASTDATPEILAEFGDKIRAIRHERNKGLSAARNTGLQHASGEFIAFLDADDVWALDKLEKQLPLFEGRERVGLVYSDMYFFDESGKLPGSAFEICPPVSGNGFVEIFIRSPIPMLTVVVRRAAFDEVGRFDEGLTAFEDNDMWLRISETWEVSYVNEALAGYRQSPNQMSREKERMLRNVVTMKEKAFSEHPSIRELNMDALDRGLYQHYLKLAFHYIGEGQRGKAAPVLLNYLRRRGITRRWLGALAAGFLPKRGVDLLLKIKKSGLKSPC